MTGSTDAAHDAYLDRPINDLFLHALYRWNIAIECGRCRYTAIFNGPQIWWCFQSKGWSTSMHTILPRFRCTSCGGKATRWRRTRDAATRTLPWPDDREWKRMVSRYRS